jgi:adenylate kinase
MRIALFFLMIAVLPYSLIASSNPPQVVILLGAPASGKGTQAVQLSKALGIPHISTGDLFRENIEKNTELGKKVKSYMETGKLVPDDLVLALLFERISKNDATQGYVLDGFPRTIPQAEALEKKLPLHATVTVLNLVVSDDTILKRALGRKRSDDTPEVIKERLKNYYAQTEPLVEYYKKKGLLKNVDGEKSPELVFDELKKSLSVPNQIEIKK